MGFGRQIIPRRSKGFGRQGMKSGRARASADEDGRQMEAAKKKAAREVSGILIAA